MNITSVILTGTFFVLAGCKSSADQTNIPTAKQGADSVAAFILQPQAANRTVTFPGELLAYEKAEVFAKIPCYLKKVLVDMGDRVATGQVLALAEAPEMQAQYAQTIADAEVAGAKLAGSRDAFERMKRASFTEGAVAAGDLERLRNLMMADSANLLAAKSKQQVIANLKDYLTIRAPFSGIITRRFMDAGALVGTPQSQPIFSIENNSQLRLRLPIPEIYSAAIPDGQNIQFNIDALPGESFSAKLTRKSGSIDLENRTELWEFVAQNQGGKLKSGMYLTAKLVLGRTGESFVVPPTAIATTLEKKFVIALHEGKALWIDVKQGMGNEKGVEVFGMLSKGDTILARGNDEIKPGTSILPRFQKP